MAMKESRIEWVGLIPDDWKIAKNNRLFNISKQLVNENWKNTQLLSLTKSGIIEKNINDGGGKQPESFGTYQYVEKDNIVLCLFDIDVSAVFSDRSKYDGMISPAYRVMKCTDAILPVYAKWWFDAVNIGRYYLIYTKSLRKTIDANGFGNILTVVPPLSEQQAIADYLDETCSKIDEIIAEAKASIDEYKKMKQSVIFEAVTKGLDKNVEMKAVHLEYLDSCPMDWSILPVSMLFDFFGGFAYKSDRFCEQTNNQVVRLGNVKDDELRLSSNPVYISDEYADDSSKATIKVDDILFTMTGTRGKGDYFYTLIITEDDLKEKNLFLNQRVGCFRKAYHTVYMPYYNYLLKSPKIRERVFLYETGTANQGNIGIENINRIRLYNPPIEVQKNIVRMLNKKCSTMDFLITEKESLINDLEAYKKSLIYEVVTGKRRVV